MCNCIEKRLLVEMVVTLAGQGGGADRHLPLDLLLTGLTLHELPQIAALTPKLSVKEKELDSKSYFP
jgi:hypothetical protein